MTYTTMPNESLPVVAEKRNVKGVLSVSGTFRLEHVQQTGEPREKGDPFGHGIPRSAPVREKRFVFLCLESAEIARKQRLYRGQFW